MELNIQHALERLFESRFAHSQHMLADEPYPDRAQERFVAQILRLRRAIVNALNGTVDFTWVPGSFLTRFRPGYKMEALEKMVVLLKAAFEIAIPEILEDGINVTLALTDPEKIELDIGPYRMVIEGDDEDEAPGPHDIRYFVRQLFVPLRRQRMGPAG